MNKALLAIGVCIIALTGCSKNTGVTTTTNTTATSGTTGTGTVSGTTTSSNALDLMRDSVLLYTQEDYYWSDAIPTAATFQPRTYSGSTDILALKSELFKLSQYKINSATWLPYEYVSATSTSGKYSLIDAGQVATKLSDFSGDFGISVNYNSTADLRIRDVIPGSPADIAGIKRGYQVKSINGSTVINYDLSSGGTNIAFVNNAILNSSTVTLVLTKYDGTSATYNLTSAAYTNVPVLYSHVYDLGNGKKVGYLVFNSFVALATTKSALDAAFATFKSSAVTDLIVDLRYNGGGYVETAEYLDNLIAPSSTTGSLMYNTYYNTLLQSGKSVLLKNQVRKDATTGTVYNYSQVDYSVAGNVKKFSTAHPLNLSRVFFIVTGATASAAELTVNNLRPYMDVRLIGSTTYGKPVGFFDININKYTMYIPEFETRNAADVGGYYSGLTPGSTDFPSPKNFLSADDLTKDFGDATEKLLGSTLGYIKSGTYALSDISTTQVQSFNTNTFSLQDQTAGMLALDPDKFKGMIFQNHKHN